MTRSAAPFPLLKGPITCHARIDSGMVVRPPVVEVEGSAVPQYWADLFYARLQRVAGLGAGQLPTMDQFRKLGGFMPLPFLDLLAGGVGDGARWMWIEHRRHALVDFELIAVPLYESPLSKSCLPFPVQGTRVDDGTGVEPGFIPEWMAHILVRRWRRFDPSAAPATLEAIRKAGGLAPVTCLDLIIGGRGDGLAHRMVEKRWTDERQLTDLERGLLSDATLAPEAVKSPVGDLLL